MPQAGRGWLREPSWCFSLGSIHVDAKTPFVSPLMPPGWNGWSQDWNWVVTPKAVPFPFLDGGFGSSGIPKNME